MKIHSLEIHNILSIEHASLTFGDAGLVLVEGFDYDTGRANGAGKSAIFNALSFALYDKVPRRITKSEILRKGVQQGYSLVEVATNRGVYGVKRERPVATTYFHNGKKVDMTQEEFEGIIGLNYDQFLVTMYTAQDTPEKFINLNDTQKKNFILKIMDLGKFTQARNEVIEQQKKLEQEKELIKVKLEGLKANISIYKGSLVDPLAIQSKIDQNSRDIVAYTNAIKKLEDIKEPDISKYAETEAKIQQKLMDLQTFKVKCQAKRRELQHLKNLTPDATCPKCNADLNIIDGDLCEAGDTVAIDDQIKVVSSQINEYETEMAKEHEINDLIKRIKAKKQEEYVEFNNAQSSIFEYKNSINLKNADSANLLSQITKNDEIKFKVKEIVEHAKILMAKLASVDDELFLLSAVESVFDTTGAPAYVMDSIIDNFNNAVSEYVSEIWPNATYTLQTYKANKDKSIKAKFSETLTINGKERSIGSLSGGEVRALSLALDFAIIEVLSSQYGLGLNPVILDEPFNGLDSIGRELVIDILSKFSQFRQVWVVDHASEAKAMFNQTIRVEKRNGVSKIA